MQRKRDGVLRTYQECESTDNLGMCTIRVKEEDRTLNFYYDKRNPTARNTFSEVVRRREYRDLKDWLLGHDTDMVVLDAGSHMGSVGILYANYIDLVICMEPSYVNYSFMLENLRLNGVYNVIAIPGALVHNYENKVLLNYHETNSTDSTVQAKRRNSREVVVNAFNFSDMIYTFNINCVKMDIEGEEVPIILHTDIEALNMLDFMIFEYHEYLMKENFGKSEGMRTSYRNEVFSRLEKYFEVTPRGCENFHDNNIIICKNKRFE